MNKPRIKPTDEQLRAQIEAATAEQFPAHIIEDRIADSLLLHGRFQGRITAEELAVILRNMIYTRFAQHKLGGREVGLVHNVAKMKVNINESRADVKFIVHIHKPIVAFLNFKYTLVNDPVSLSKNLRLKRGSLTITEHTRRFDIKAKAALATINTNEIALKELADPAGVISATLPPQLERRGAEGHITKVELALKDHHLEVFVEGEFWRHSIDQPGNH